MGQVTVTETTRRSPFNSPVEIGLRSLVLLDEMYPAGATVERLVVLDYLVVHSDDLPDGPEGLHPKTPNRSGELLVRRGVLQEGLTLYATRRLIHRTFSHEGILFLAGDTSTSFLDSLDSEYVAALRDRGRWLINEVRSMSDVALRQLADEHLGEWGAEFTRRSVLWAEECE